MSRYRSPAIRRYQLRLGAALAAYIVTLSAALRFVGGGEVTGVPAYALALLPGLSVAAMFWAIGRLLVEEADEYIRMLMVRQALVATGLTLAFGDVGQGFKKLLQILFGLAIAFAAASFFLPLVGGGGAVLPA